MPDRARLLEMALKGLESDRSKLDEEIAEIKREIGHRPAGAKPAEVKTAVGAPGASRKKRTMSAEARRKISEGMKRRYAELKRLAGANKK
jgi:hypothetical protein